MKPGFEEKTFESYFNAELNNRSSFYFPFGQVQEGVVGADASAMTWNRGLWGLLGYPYFFRRPAFVGVDMREIADEMEILLGREVENIPSVRVNLIFQYKRSEKIVSSQGAEWLHWNEPYYRYEIYQKQQSLLSSMAGSFGTQALILYAAPALHGVDDLVRAKNKKKIIELTNFRPAEELDGHHVNTFTKAGLYSIACSDPERLEPFNLQENIDRFEAVPVGGRTSFIVDFANAVRSAALESEDLGFAFESEMSEFTEAGLGRYPLLFSLVVMKKFRDLTGIQWVVA